jgi:hypothetical protein
MEEELGISMPDIEDVGIAEAGMLIPGIAELEEPAIEAFHVFSQLCISWISGSCASWIWAARVLTASLLARSGARADISMAP